MHFYWGSKTAVRTVHLRITQVQHNHVCLLPGAENYLSWYILFLLTNVPNLNTKARILALSKMGLI